MLLDVAVNAPKGATDAADVTESDFPFVSSAARGFTFPPFSDSETITEELVGAKTSTKLHVQLIKSLLGS